MDKKREKELKIKLAEAKEELKKMIDQADGIFCIIHRGGNSAASIMGEFNSDTINKTIEITAEGLARMLMVNSGDGSEIADIDEMLKGMLKRRREGMN